MHEMSIAEALVEQVRRHTPAGHRATHVCVEAGPSQAIDGDSLEFAWQAMTDGTDLAGTKLDFHALPYVLTCPACGREWTSSDPFDACACGAEGQPRGGSELYLKSLEVEPLEEPSPDADVSAKAQH